MAKRIRRVNRILFEKAKRRLVGGVNSPVRSFNYVAEDPVLIRKGKGSRIYDYDGNGYIDYCLSWGAMILGHCNPLVLKAVKKALDHGSSFGATNKSEIELAGLIKGAIGFAEKIRFVNSGTEAVMGAVRVARGYTGRDDIVKFENSYHGHADYLLTKTSAGVPEDFTKHTITAPPDDLEAIECIFKKYGQRIAAVLIEPVGGNYGVVPPDPEFLKRLRKLTERYGALLIADEVITGFRFNFGSSIKSFGVIPDLIVLGKIIGGGFPAGAYGGSEKIMRLLAPSGKVYQASTFAGNPVTMEAGLATLNTLKRSETGYKRTKDFTSYLVSKLAEEARSRGIGLKTSCYGNMFSMKFADLKIFRRFYRLMLEDGIYFVPSEFEANFISFSHKEKDIDKTVDALKRALERI